jgi:hypothetical protein
MARMTGNFKRGNVSGMGASHSDAAPRDRKGH